MPTIARPAPSEYAPYYGTYVNQVPDGDVLALLSSQLDDTAALLKGVPASRWGHRYAPGKWSVAQVVGHVIDVERVFGYRALRFARGDATPLPGFDENAWTPMAGYDRRPLPRIADELRATRQATLAFFRGLEDEAVGRRGSANNVEFTVGAIAWIIAGHERHHVKILTDRYLQTG
jgi:hypothetical protein